MMADAAIADTIDLGVAREWLADGRVEQAQVELERCLARGVSPITAQFLYGLCRLRRDETESALDAFNEVVRARPRDHMAHFYAGLCYERLGFSARAGECYRNALELDPGLPDPGPFLAAGWNLGSDLREGLSPRLETGVAALDDHTPGPPVQTIPPIGLNLAGRCLFAGHPRARSFGGHVAAIALSTLATTVLGLALVGSPGLLPLFGLGLSVCTLLSVALALRGASSYVEILERRINIRSGIWHPVETSIWVHRIETVWISRSMTDRITGDAVLHLRAGGPGIPLAWPRHIQLRGLGCHAFVARLCQEIKAAALVDRRELRSW